MTIEKVQKEFSRMNSRRRSLGRNIATLGISVVLFLGLGLLGNSLSGIVMLLGVLLVHEGGHFLGMKILGYRDVHMFFIPLLGAAVSGKETAPSGAKKAVVSLLGPCPGILIGVATGMLYWRTGNPVLADATRTFLFLNAFNLLPIPPLDGGQLFDAVLFSRHPRIELGFKVIAVLILAWIAVAFKDRVFGLLAFLVFFSLRGTSISANIASAIKKDVEGKDCVLSEDPPESCVGKMIDLLKGKIPARHWKPKLFAVYVTGIWQRVRSRPCSIGQSIGFILCYTFCLLLGLGAFIVFEGVVPAGEARRLPNVEQSAAPPPHEPQAGAPGGTAAEFDVWR